jgi:tRNA threonylcarbamoyladenosine biosynthesis protein TsaE
VSSEPAGAVHVSDSEARTVAVARDLAADLRAGDVILLSGNLGTGKTAFVRGLAEGLGVAPGEVSSPTFTLLHEYRGGRLPLYHADLYRVDETGAGDLGLDELTDGVLAVEWPDRLTHEPRGAWHVGIEWIDESSRRIRIEKSTALRGVR